MSERGTRHEQPSAEPDATGSAGEAADAGERSEAPREPRRTQVDRERARRRGLRAALRVAGLAGIVVTAVANASEPPGSIPSGARVAAGGCCGSWRFWGPPAPVAMRKRALARLRRARRQLATEGRRS